MLYLLYLPTEIWRAQGELRILRELRKIAIFVRFVTKWILAKFVAERLNESCAFYETYEHCDKSQFS